jgi:hypothetical protein
MRRLRESPWHGERPVHNGRSGKERPDADHEQGVDGGDTTDGSIQGKEHACEVVRTKDGLRYRLKDGKEFNSPSSAGMQITGGIAVNGWRFWSVEGDLKTRPDKGQKLTKSRTKKAVKSKGE